MNEADPSGNGGFWSTSFGRWLEHLVYVPTTVNQPTLAAAANNSAALDPGDVSAAVPPLNQNGGAASAGFRRDATAVAVGFVGSVALGALTGGGSGGEAADQFIDPAAVRFTQKSCNWNFSEAIKIGGVKMANIGDMVDALKSGALDPAKLDPIRLFEKDGQLYSLDNRRLVAFQRAGVPIRYRLATGAEVKGEGWKLDTGTGGISIRVRGEP